MSKVLFRVGEIVFLAPEDTLTVIIGWDETFQGPGDWLDVDSYLDEPFYLVNEAPNRPLKLILDYIFLFKVLTDFQGSEIGDEPFLYVPQVELYKVLNPRCVSFYT